MIISMVKEGVSKATNIVSKFEENVKIAQTALENTKDKGVEITWDMTMNGKNVMPPMPKAQVVRTFLKNHLYHYRGKWVAHLRGNSHKVSGCLMARL